jgi:hypothetical protein
MVRFGFRQRTEREYGGRTVMFSIFKRRVQPVLQVGVNGEELCAVVPAELPCEKEVVVQTGPDGVLELAEPNGEVRTHALGAVSGWYHFSIRVHDNLACQVDCVITASEKYDPAAFAAGEATGVRFQPFFLRGAAVANEELHGKGLFARGLHFGGTVTPGNVVLSCQCDSCRRSFQIRSFHAGFSNAGYFYSGSGRYTLIVSDRVAGCPAALVVPDASELGKLEAALPPAPDGTSFNYRNPFRCPHCAAPFIDFLADPTVRPGEYYGNFLVGSELLSYEPAPD